MGLYEAVHEHCIARMASHGVQILLHGQEPFCAADYLDETSCRGPGGAEISTTAWSVKTWPELVAAIHLLYNKSMRSVRLSRMFF